MVRMLKYLTIFVAAFLLAAGIILVKQLHLVNLERVLLLVTILVIPIISLLAYFFLHLNWNKKTIRFVTIAAPLMLVIAIICFYQFSKEYNHRTVTYTDKETNVTYYFVKGTKPDSTAAFMQLLYKKKFGKEMSDEELLEKREVKPELVWTPDTIKKNKDFLTGAYLAVVVLFTSLFCLLSETLIAYKLRGRPADPHFSAFISYSTLDILFVKRLHASLKKRKITTFFWEVDAPGTRNNTTIMNSAINKMDRFLFVASASSLKSDACQHELEVARAKQMLKHGENIYTTIYIDETIFSLSEEGVIVKPARKREEVWGDILTLRQFNPCNFKAFAGEEIDEGEYEKRLDKFIVDALTKKLENTTD